MASAPVSNTNNKWQRTPSFRNAVVQRIARAQQTSKRPSSKSAEVIEIHIYNNTATKAEYEERLAITINHMNWDEQPQVNCSRPE